MTPPLKSFKTQAFVVWWLWNSPRFWRALTLCLFGGVAFSLVTLICFRIGTRVAPPALLYLLVIVLLSLHGNFVLSAAFSLIGVACLDYYFTSPKFSFQVDDPANIVALVVFLIVSAITTPLVFRLKETMARQFEMTLDARVAERTRIARDLHDTLLQSFHGLLLRFQTAFSLLPDRPAESKQVLGSAIDQAAEAITEGRDAVQGLRTSATERNDLTESIRALGEELANESSSENVLRVEVQGTPRALHPIVRDEVFRIAGEALRNAFRHAAARQIEVELRYDERQLRLRVRDDGKGIDSEVLRAEGCAGHFGLHGMRERAKLIGGKLTVWTAPESGTEIELNVPADHVYAAPSAPHQKSSD